MDHRLVPPVATEGPALAELRLEVRAFLAEQVASGVFVPHVDTWLTRWDRDFTRELGRRGWLGMVVPTIRIRDNLQLTANVYVVKLRGIEIARGDPEPVQHVEDLL